MNRRWLSSSRSPAHAGAADGPSSVFYSDGTTLTPSLIPTFSEQHDARFHVLDLDVDGEVDIVIPYKNRYLATNRVGAMRKTASNLTSVVMPSATNTIAATFRNRAGRSQTTCSRI